MIVNLSMKGHNPTIVDTCTYNALIVVLKHVYNKHVQTKHISCRHA